MSEKGTIDRFDIGVDPLDAIARGEVADDHDLASFVSSLHAVYGSPNQPHQSPTLRRFTELGRPRPAPEVRRRRRLAAVAAFAGTVVGKLALGGAVAVAAAGGLHATDTVRLPFVPHFGEDPSELRHDPAPEMGNEPVSSTGEPTGAQTSRTTAPRPVGADSSTEPAPSAADEPSTKPGAAPANPPVTPPSVPVPTVTIPPAPVPLPEVSVPEVP